jgi:hypothetical protein
LATGIAPTNCNTQLTQTAKIGITPLPVELMSFTVRCINNKTILEWVTATEQNCNRFELEKSLDGKAFKKFGTVGGNNNSITTIRYSFTDENPGGSVVYYRLKQVDHDGTFALSKIVTARFTSLNKPEFTLYPNPASGNIRVMADVNQSESAVIVLRDALGRMVGKEMKANLISGQNILTLETAGLNAGLYFVQISTGSHHQTLKFQKVNK